MSKQLNLDWNFVPDNSFIRNFKRSNYDPWYAIAELIDNSTGSLERNYDALKKIYEKEKSTLEVQIEYKETEDYFSVYDNAMGISEENLKRLIKYSVPPPVDKRGRSRYGMGLKTAGWWMGDIIEIETSYYGESKMRRVVLDSNLIADGNSDCEPEVHEHEKESHFTKINIKKLDKSFRGKRITKIKKVLSSIYKRDLNNNDLELEWNGDPIKPLNLKCQKNIAGEELKEFVEIVTSSGKKLKGWLGCLKLGGEVDGSGRPNAGISLFYGNRGIRVYPDAWRPESLFGEYASNDKVNQRLFGEFDVEGFELNHTKDDISWTISEYDKVVDNLGDKGRKMRNLCKQKVDEFQTSETPDKDEHKLTSDMVMEDFNKLDFEKYLTKRIISNPETIKASKESLTENDLNDETFLKNYKVGNLSIDMHLVNNSPYNPYCLIERSSSKDLIIVINGRHPYVTSCRGERLFEFYRQTIYDAIVNEKLVDSHLKKEVDNDILILEKDYLMKELFQVN